MDSLQLIEVPASSNLKLYHMKEAPGVRVYEIRLLGSS
jgi:hypothetical protein